MPQHHVRPTGQVAVNPKVSQHPPNNPIKGWKLLSRARKHATRYGDGAVVNTLEDGTYVVVGPERVRPDGGRTDRMVFGYGTQCWLSECGQTLRSLTGL